MDCPQVDREVLFSSVDKIVGYNTAPETVIKEGKFGYGSCMEWIDKLETGDRGHDAFGYEFSEAVSNGDKDTALSMRNQVMAASIMDYICGSCDRHHGNWGFDAKNNKLWLIDNGLTFGNSASSWNKDFDRFERPLWGGRSLTSGKALWEMVSSKGNAERGGMDFLKPATVRKDYHQMCLETMNKVKANVGVIEKLFDKHGLPEKERKIFWKNVDKLATHEIPGYAR